MFLKNGQSIVNLVMTFQATIISMSKVYPQIITKWSIHVLIYFSSIVKEANLLIQITLNSVPGTNQY